MASKDGPAARAVDLWSELQRELLRLRLLPSGCAGWNAPHPDKPRIGRSERPVDDPVRLAQDPSLAFAAVDPRLVRAGQGWPATAPRGALLRPARAQRPAPAASDRIRLGPPAQRPRPHVQPLPRRLPPSHAEPVLSGLGEQPADGELRPPQRGPVRRLCRLAVRPRHALAARARRPARPWPSSTMPACSPARPAIPTGCGRCCGDYFRLPAAIREFIGEWMALPRAARCRLGLDAGRPATLGESAIAGARIWSGQHKFRLVLGPLGLTDFRRFLPGGREPAAARRRWSATMSATSSAWDLNPVLAATRCRRCGSASTRRSAGRHG